MDERTDADSDKNIREDLLCCGCDLSKRIFNTVLEMQLLLREINGSAVSYVVLHLVLKLKLLYQHASGNGDHQAEHNIDNSDLPSENAHEQNKTA